MSGGVDSSVAAHLLLEQGHEVIGVFMRHGEQSPAACSTSTSLEPQATSHAASLPIVNAPGQGRLDHKQGCCTAADAEDARRVSDRLAIPFYALDLNAEFGQIMDYFAEEYARGRTPNPCVQCNNWIKFGKLFDYADSVDAEFVATGHYARLQSRGDEVALLRGVDAGKDQSYVLFGIDKGLLPRMMLPVGGYEKPVIRQIAGTLGLNVAEKKDSQEICFVTQGRYDAFVKQRIENRGFTNSTRESRVVPDPDAVGFAPRAGVEDDPARTVDRAGDLVTTDGTVVGQHAGIEGFTVGQRKGLGVALGERKFVVRIEPDTNRVVLGDRGEMLRGELTAKACNWLIDLPIGESICCMAQIRYNAPAAAGKLTLSTNGQLHVAFDEPQFGVAPGQAVVCYDADEPTRVLGGGWIE